MQSHKFNAKNSPVVDSPFVRRTSMFVANDFSPQNVLYVAQNGSGGGDGSFGNPFRLPSQAISAAISGDVSNTNPYLIIVFTGNYTEAVDLSLVRPGLYSYFHPGVRLNMGANYLTAEGWDGVAGAFTGINGFKPLVFGGVTISIPDDGIASWTVEDNNWNAASDTIAILSNNESVNSIFTAINCEISIGAIQGFDETYNGCSGQTIFSTNDTGWQNKSINITGGSNFNVFSIATNGASTINAQINSAFVNEFNADTNNAAGVSSLTCTQGEIGEFTPSTSGGGVLPTPIIQEWCGAETKDADILDKNVSWHIDADLAGSARLNAKFKSGVSLTEVKFGTKEIYFPVPATADNDLEFSPSGAPFLCATIYQGSGNKYLLGQIPFDGSTKIVDILVEGFIDGISVSNMTINVAASWAGLGDRDDANNNTGSIPLLIGADATFVRFSLMSILGDASPDAGRAIQIGDNFAVILSSTTSATKVFYATGIVVLFQ